MFEKSVPANISTGVLVNEKTIPTVISTSMDGSSTRDPKVSSDQNQQGAFFPWLENDVEHKNLSARVLTRFPVLGAVGLIGSALTVVLSFLVLHFFDDKKTVTGRMPKPAAWLSIILSVNSILVHMAVSQGITVSWWYRATKQQTTIGDLHNVWATGSRFIFISWVSGSSAMSLAYTLEYFREVVKSAASSTYYQSEAQKLTLKT